MALVIKALALASVAPLIASASPAPSETEQPIAPKITCQQTKGYTAGTAFRIGPNLLLTARHVINSGQCQIDGQPVRIVYSAPDSDVAILQDDRPGKFLKVDCEGYKPEGHYLAAGHARALDEITITPLIGTGKKDGYYSLLVGIYTVQPGQSGGAIIDASTGKVVGIVNAANWATGVTYSIELKSTSVCNA